MRIPEGMNYLQTLLTQNQDILVNTLKTYFKSEIDSVKAEVIEKVKRNTRNELQGIKKAFGVYKSNQKKKQTPKTTKPLTQMHPNYANKVVREWKNSTYQRLGNDTESLNKGISSIVKSHPEIADMQVNNSQYQKIIKQREKREAEQQKHSWGQAAFDYYSNTKFKTSQNAHDQKRILTTGIRGWIYEEDGSRTTQPKTVKNSDASFSDMHYKSFYHHTLKQNDFRKSLRVYQYGKEDKVKINSKGDSLIQLITFIPLPDMVRYTIWEYIFDIGYLGNSGGWSIYHVEKAADVLCGVIKADEEYVISDMNIDKLKAMGMDILSSEFEITFRNNVLYIMFRQRDSAAKVTGYPKDYSTTGTLLRNCNAPRGVLQSDSHHKLVDVGTVKDNVNMYNEFDATQITKIEGNERYFYKEINGKRVYFEQGWKLLSGGDLSFMVGCAGVMDGTDIYGMIINCGKKVNKDSCYYIEGGTIHGIYNKRIDGYQLHPVTDKNIDTFLELIAKKQVFNPKRLKQYAANNKKPNAWFATHFPGEAFDHFWNLTDEKLEELKLRLGKIEFNKLTEKQLNDMMKKEMQRDYEGSRFYKRGVAVLKNGVPFDGMHCDIRVSSNRYGSSNCIMKDTYKWNLKSIQQIGERVKEQVGAVAGKIIADYLKDFATRKYGTKLVKNVDGRQSDSLMDMIGIHVVAFANSDAVKNSNEQTIYLCFELLIYECYYVSHFMYLLTKYNPSQATQLTGSFRKKCALIGLKCYYYSIKLQPYLQRLFGSFPITAEFFLDEYELAMSVFRGQGNERYNVNIKGAAGNVIRKPVCKADNIALVNEVDANGTEQLNYDKYPNIPPSNACSQVFTKLKNVDMMDMDRNNASFGKRNKAKIKQKQIEENKRDPMLMCDEKIEELLSKCSNKAFVKTYHKLRDWDPIEQKQIDLMTHEEQTNIKLVFSAGQGLKGNDSKEQMDEKIEMKTIDLQEMKQVNNNKSKRKGRKKKQKIVLESSDSDDEDLLNEMEQEMELSDDEMEQEQEEQNDMNSPPRKKGILAKKSNTRHKKSISPKRKIPFTKRASNTGR
eukprot:524847_1